MLLDAALSHGVANPTHTVWAGVVWQLPGP